MKTNQFIIIGILSIFFNFILHSQTAYYVSSTAPNNNGNGSLLNPWKDIQYGLDQLAAGDTLTVLDGIYKEALKIDTTSGSPGNYITLKGSPNTVLSGDTISPVGQHAMIEIIGVNYIIVDGFEIRDFETATGFDITDSPIGILVQGTCDQVIVQNNIIHDIKNKSTCTQNDGCGPSANGIAVFGNTASGITNIDFINNEIYGCELSSSESFTLNGNINGFRIIDNYVHDNNNIGIDFIGYESDICMACPEADNRARNGLVKGNRSVNNSSFTNPWYTGDKSAGGFYVDGGRNIIFDRNISSNNDYGFEFASEQPGKATEEILMHNNLVCLNSNTGLSLGGYDSDPANEGGGSSKKIYTYNNSLAVHQM